METRVDTRCLRNRSGDIFAVNEGAGDRAEQPPVCKHCGGGHHTSLCASRAAAVRNKTETSEREHARWGTTCHCGRTDHLESHHLRAAEDSFGKPRNKGGGIPPLPAGTVNAVTGNVLSIDGLSKRQQRKLIKRQQDNLQAQSETPPGVTPCKYGEKCNRLDRVKYPQGCPNWWHPIDHCPNQGKYKSPILYFSALFIVLLVL